MATSEKQDLDKMVAQAEAAMTPQEKQTREYIKRQDDILGVLYLRKIREVALDGFRKGFKINILYPKEIEEGAGIPHREKNILTGEMEEDKDWKPRPFKKQALTTKDYNDFIQYRYKWLNEKSFGNQAEAEDMENRLYEFAAKKFLGMDHNTYTQANKEELRLAVDACTQITAWNGQFMTKEDLESAKLDEVAEESGTTVQVPRFKVRDPTGEYSINLGDDLQNTDD